LLIIRIKTKNIKDKVWLFRESEKNDFFNIIAIKCSCIFWKKQLQKLSVPIYHFSRLDCLINYLFFLPVKFNNNLDLLCYLIRLVNVDVRVWSKVQNCIFTAEKRSPMQGISLFEFHLLWIHAMFLEKPKWYCLIILSSNMHHIQTFSILRSEVRSVFHQIIRHPNFAPVRCIVQCSESSFRRAI